MKLKKTESSEATTDFAIIVQERKDGSMALYIKISHQYAKRHEERSVFTVSDRLDSRLEQYLRELADAERSTIRRKSVREEKSTALQFVL